MALWTGHVRRLRSQIQRHTSYPLIQLRPPKHIIQLLQICKKKIKIPPQDSNIRVSNAWSPSEVSVQPLVCVCVCVSWGALLIHLMDAFLTQSKLSLDLCWRHLCALLCTAKLDEARLAPDSGGNYADTISESNYRRWNETG